MITTVTAVVLIVIFILATISGPFAIGKPRKPFTAGSYVFDAIIYAITVALLWSAYL